MLSTSQRALLAFFQNYVSSCLSMLVYFYKMAAFLDFHLLVCCLKSDVGQGSY